MSLVRLAAAVPAPDPKPGVGASLPGGVERVMSPTGVAILIVIAFAVDYFSVGPAWLQTRLVFMCVVTAVRQGFDDSPLDDWTVDQASGIIQKGLDAAKGAYIAGASANAIVGAIVGILFIYTLGCMIPVKWSKIFGRLSTAQFKETAIRKMSMPVWALAVPLGLLADMPTGTVGSITVFAVDLYASFTSFLPSVLFGVSQ